ncbi:MAG: HlyD family efflux transporter periplasmic adaptor subunit [Vulcanococcus sp.]|jgi:HlyD family secretion protein|uniref:HlyD family efflux transporter periplasmic adaptor subunit n=1 Tax=Vulcanococcus sp. TaxID=2856995 RepID=UPI0025CD896B|nr:HlyD family efflux transporter periplasmic adaptor subunit [Vulcanococcus sp.]MBW0173953.1 HlyD family efflux transporter periplasmic adaptor subunit [Vulcanococcus sp.]MBW0181145.1 HlyD family efflux transporter periplasmic adaptor subunit [Vulcanococcus sp.]
MAPAPREPFQALRRLWRRQPAPPPASTEAVDLIGDVAKPVEPVATGLDTTVEHWSFQQPVLLRPSTRPRSVIVWSFVGGTALLLVWSVVAPLGESVAVQGKLRPSRQVKQLEAPVAGVVADLLVKEGQAVEADQLLMQFDLRQARSQLTAADAVRARLLSENRIYAAALEERPSPGLSANQQLQLRNQSEQLRSSRRVAQEELNQSRQRLQGLSDSWSTAADIARRYRNLARAGAVSAVQELQTRETANQLRSQMLEEQRAIAKLEANLQQVQAAPAAELRGRIEANLRQISDLDGQIRQARLQIQFGQLRAPLSGVVFDLRVSPRSVVESGAALLALVPGGTLEARVLVPSKVIGFISPGMAAKLSLDTFPANDYGRLPAVVQRIGSDALTPEEMRSALGAEATGLFYPVVLRLQQQHLQARGRAVRLKAGMTLTADIQLRQRPFISVITSLFEDKLRNLERLR